MSRRPSPSARRRRLLSLQVADALDPRLEARSTVTPFGAAALAISAVPAVAPPVGLHACNL